MNTQQLEAKLLKIHGPRDYEPEAETTTETHLKAIGIKDFLLMDFPPRENILAPWLSTQGLCMVHAIRGIGKTHFALGVAVAVSSGGTFLNWTAPEPRGVLYIDGEMPGVVMQERLSRIIASTDEEPTAPLKIITPDLQKQAMPNLATAEGQAILEPHLERISLVIVDNISTLCRGGRENDADSWQVVQDWALRLRTRGLSILFIHHAGKGGQQRGTSRREDILDTVINLRHSADYTADKGACFEVHFEKNRGIYGDDTKSIEAMLNTMPDGTQSWAVKYVEDSLTEKVAALLAEGLTQRDIATELNITQGTVSKHKKKAKLLKLIE